jgi:hypothetical protein
MDEYKPVPWSIGYIAVNDPRFKGYNWVFGKHVISEAIGDNATDLWTEYLLQVTQYNQVRDHTIVDLTEDPLDEHQQYLRAPIREHLKQWVETLQNSEDTIIMCEGIGQEEEAMQNNEDIPEPTGWRYRMRRKASKILGRSRNPTNTLPQESMDGHQDAQVASTAKTRWAEKRTSFTKLLEQLNHHVLFFSDQIKPKQSRSGIARLLEAPQQQIKMHRQMNRYRDAGDTMKWLIESIRKVERADQLTFQLMLHSDPFELQSDLRGISPACEEYLDHGGAAFYLRLVPDADFAAHMAEQWAMPRRVLAEAKYFVFSVSSAASEVLDKFYNVEAIFSRRETPVGRPDWAVMRGDVDKEAFDLEKTIRVISDSTTHMVGRSLVSCLADREEQRILRKASYAGMRAELAFRVASSLFYNLYVDGLHDLHAQDLYFYTALNRKKQEPEYKISRLAPFVALSSLGSTAAAPSSSDALSGATNDLEAMMIQNLGILIYEIGAWNRVTGRGLAERVSKVKKDKERLLASISPTYGDVIDACFRYQKDGDVDEWILRNVLIPLKEVCESRKRPGP